MLALEKRAVILSEITDIKDLDNGDANANPNGYDGGGSDGEGEDGKEGEGGKRKGKGKGHGKHHHEGKVEKKKSGKGEKGAEGAGKEGGASAAKKRAFLEKKAKVALNHITELESKGEAQREILNHVLGKLAKVTDDVSAAGEAAPEETQRTYARVKEVC